MKIPMNEAMLMSMFGKDIENFKQLYITQLRFMYSSEKQIVEGLEKMIDAASDPQLKDAFQSHLQETKVHVQRVQSILGNLTGDADDKKCPVTAALIAAGENVVKETEAGPVRDAGLIASAQKIEHFEMASYGSVRNWAQRLGYNDQAQTLNQTLQEEGHADHLLTQIAERANQTATQAA
jgi:ferritin-like metal-binding protein YciE